MTSAQKVIVKNWKCTGVFLLAMASTFILASEHRLSAGLACGFVLVLMPIFNPELRQWKGYGAKGLRLGQYLQEHGILQLWVVGFCLLALPVLIYRIYSSGGDAWGLYALSFGLLIGPIVTASEIERYRAAGSERLTNSGTRTR
ncbi:hypothetical protein Q672_20335 [Marinobacter sp. EVN1]|nr:hypothetical protein Q672_20335 [Marinobacter sp. EVN1]